MTYKMVEVDGELAAEVLHSMNSLAPERFPALEGRHLEEGYWWLLKDDANTLCGFAGLVPCDPFVGVGYLKRAFVSPDHRGSGLQYKMIEARIEKAKELGWHQLVTECKNNPRSEFNLLRAGFERCEPEQVWGEPGSVYFSKLLT